MKLLKNAGIFLMPFSIFYCCFLDFFTMIGPWMFCFGVFLVAFSQVLRLFNGKLSDAVQIIIIVFPFVAYISYSLFIHRAYRQIIVVPENYEGMLTINYAVDTAKEVETDWFAPVVYVCNRHEVNVRYDPFKWRNISIEGVEFYWNTKNGKKVYQCYSGEESIQKCLYIAERCGPENCVFVITKDYNKYFKKNTFNILIDSIL